MVSFKHNNIHTPSEIVGIIASVLGGIGLLLIALMVVWWYVAEKKMLSKQVQSENIEERSATAQMEENNFTR